VLGRYEILQENGEGVVVVQCGCGDVGGGGGGSGGGRVEEKRVYLIIMPPPLFARIQTSTLISSTLN